MLTTQRSTELHPRILRLRPVWLKQRSRARVRDCNVRVTWYVIEMDGELELLGERIAEQAAHLDAAMHRLLTDLREFDARGGWFRQGAKSCAHWLAWRVGWDLSTARDRVRVAAKVGEFAVIDDALRRGEISYSKVRAMMRVATPDNEVLLLDHARLMTASHLEKLCRKYAVVQPSKRRCRRCPRVTVPALRSSDSAGGCGRHRDCSRAVASDRATRRKGDSQPRRQ